MRHVMATLIVGVMAVQGAKADPALAEQFYRAVRDNDMTRLAELSRTADVDVVDARGATPLMYAAIYGTTEQLALLLDAGAQVDARNALGGTALISAAGDPAKSRLLIERGADVHARSQQGRTPLMVAAQREGNRDLVRLLLSRGADARAEDTQRDTALLGAAATGDVGMMQPLLDAGANVNVATTVQGLTPLGLAISSNRVDAVKLLLARGADVRLHGMNDAVTVRAGRLALRDQTNLILAAAYGSPEMVDTLLAAGADVRATDGRLMTPLMTAVASETQDPRVVRRLLAAGAPVNAISAADETALDWASKFNSAPVLALLHKAEAKRAATPMATPPSPVPTAANDGPASALRTTVALLQRSSTEFSRAGGCVGCHHQPATAMATRDARASGLAVDEDAARDQQRTMSAQAATLQGRLLQAAGSGVVIDLGLAQGLRESEYPPDPITDALVTRIANVQRADGSWPGGAALSRAPMSEGSIARTVEAVRALQAFRYPAARVNFDARIAQARQWLLQQRPRTTDDHAMRLLGLSIAGAARRHVDSASKQLIALQHRDGGWGGNPNLPSDAFATGQALYALRGAGVMAAAHPVHRRGVAYLLATWSPDGAWHVRSRAAKIQPYFESGFPFGHDQWISAAATAWAATALAADIERTRQAMR